MIKRPFLGAPPATTPFVCPEGDGEWPEVGGVVEWIEDDEGVWEWPLPWCFGGDVAEETGVGGVDFIWSAELNVAVRAAASFSFSFSLSFSRSFSLCSIGTRVQKQKQQQKA